MRTVLNSEIKGGPGAISSSRCQTTRALPGKPGRTRNPFTCGRAKRAVASAVFRFFARTSLRSHHGDKSFAPGPEQKRMPTRKLRNRRQSCAPNNKASQSRRASDHDVQGHDVQGHDVSDHDRRSGGARRDRTDDLLLAKQALSQLSYGPFRYQGSAIRNQGSPNS
jgi:hypothetical protein